MKKFINLLALVFIFNSLNAAQQSESDSVKKFIMINNTSNNISILVGPVQELVNDRLVDPSDMLAESVQAHESKTIILQKKIEYGEAKEWRSAIKYTKLFNTAKHFKVGTKKSYWAPFDNLTASKETEIEENAIYKVNMDSNGRLVVMKTQDQERRNVPPGGC